MVPLIRPFIVTLLVGTLSVVVWETASGQEPAAPVDTVSGPIPEKKPPPETILELILAGGPINVAFMVVLGLFSLYAVAVIFERLVNMMPGKLLPPALVNELKELLGRKEENAERYRELSEKYPGPLASILKAGVLRAGRPIPEVEKAMEDAAARETAALRSKVRPLGVLASVAPMVGLLGTVVGMVLAFRTASQAGLGKAELLAEGIYLALETTVAGLVIAIPTLLAGAWFNGRIDKCLRTIHELLQEVIPVLASLEQPAGEPPDRVEQAEQVVAAGS